MYRLHRGIMASGDGLYAAVRSFGPAAWFQPGVGVTGTLTASNWADQSGNGRDLAQGTAGNQPIYLPYSGTPYAYLPGVAGNYFSTPDSVAASITGDIDIRVKVALNDWTPSAISVLVSKWDGTTSGNMSYVFYVNTNGTIALTTTADGTTGVTGTSTAATSVTDGSVKWVRVTLDVNNGAEGKTHTFYLSDDGETWTQLGNTVTAGGTTSIYNGTLAVAVGHHASGAALPSLGKFYRAQIYNGIAGTPAVDFNPADFAETSTAGVLGNSSTTLEEWTLNSTGAKPAQIVKSASLLFDGTDDYMKTAAFTLNQPETVYLVVSQISWTANEYFVDGDAGSSMGILTRAVGGGAPDIQLYAGSSLSPHVGPAVGSFGIITAVFNGASSLLQTNATTALTGQAGTTNAGGVTLGAAGSALVPSNIQVKEVLIFPASHDAGQRATVRNYLAVKHGIAL